MSREQRVSDEELAAIEPDQLVHLVYDPIHGYVLQPDYRAQRLVADLRVERAAHARLREAAQEVSDHAESYGYTQELPAGVLAKLRAALAADGG